MTNTHRQLDSIFIGNTPRLMRQIQTRLDGPYIDCVVKSEWPKGETVQRINWEPPEGGPPKCEYGSEERAYRLQYSAINSPSICLEDIRFGWAYKQIITSIERLFVENLRQVWKTTFRCDVIRTITTRRVLREKPEHPVLTDPLPRKVNFFGKEVPAFCTKGKPCINPKYLRAATQYVEWHPDIVHFLFPDLENWAGELRYRNILDTVCNPDGTMPYFQTIMKYAARPVRPDLGSVTTVPPPGFLGTLWYWAWKLVGFIP